MIPEEQIIANFAELWWADNRRTFFANTFLGVPAFQHPFDAWVTQEILVETRPEVVVEAGSFAGGSALLWATILEQVVDEPRVIAIDQQDLMHEARQVPIFERRVHFIHGSSTDAAVVDEVAAIVEGRPTMVILDSAHDMEHVLEEIRAYAPFVSPGQYLIVQDGFCSGHPIVAQDGPGPYEALEVFLAEDDRFEVDEARERMRFTFNPMGFLRRLPD